MNILPRLSRGAAVLALAATVAGTLSACAPLVIGGAAAVGAMMVVDRRTSGTQIEDESIELRAASRVREAVGDRGHVNVSSYNRQVLLTGEVPTEQAKQAAEQVASRVENVKGTVNELVVRPASSLADRSNDTLITGKVKATIVDDKHLSVAAFRVVTERGTVYLMGRVTQREADRVTQLVRNIPGVQRVVRIFEILSEEELRQLTGGSAPAAAPASTHPASAPRP
jgi:osmotically-inducible protein OsmY